MIQKFSAHLLLLLFIAMFSYETVEFLCGKNFEHHETMSGILELDEEGGTSEESKEEKDEELKMEDNFFTEIICFQLFSENIHLLIQLNQHFQPADYSQKVYSPPEFI